ncbi:hypothetical protein H0H92_003560 [Tricholoma furcatifolium]|nr:hypothetical protein H0H92_003560 [Tricholoma furcatifolium]
MTSLITNDTTIRVSSVLDKSVGKKHLVDGSPETCWTSQEVCAPLFRDTPSSHNLQGLPQYIQLNFPTRVIPQRIHLTFQGGFVGTQCDVYAESDTEGTARWNAWTSIYPEDVNRRQSFDLPPYVYMHEQGATEPQSESEPGMRAVKLVFKQSSDFFGRITVYDLKIEGTVS